MSKSDPASAIFMEDSEAEVKTKIKKAFCPPAEVWQPTKLFPRRGQHPFFTRRLSCMMLSKEPRLAPPAPARGALLQHDAIAP